MSKAITDTDRLDWLERHEAKLITHREKNSDDGYWIFWNVVKRGKSISGHPLGSPRAAIDAAIEASGETFRTGGKKQAGGKKDVAAQARTCGNCASFRGRRGCASEVVSGAVASDAACAYWAAKE